ADGVDVLLNEIPELFEQRGVQRAGADGRGVPGDLALRHEVEVPLAGGVVVVEAEIPVLEPVERTPAVIGHAAVDPEVAAESAPFVAGADRPPVAPGHVEPGVPAADLEGRLVRDRAEFRGV